MPVQLEKRGVLGAGQVKKGGSLPRHIPILNIYVSTPPPPPGVCRGTSKKGGLRHGHNPKKGVLGTGKTKKGGLRHGHEWKKWVLGTGTGTSRKMGVLRTGLVKRQS